MPARKTASKTATKSSSKSQAYLHYHKDGSLWGKGQMRDGVMSGYWEWYRKDGVRMRSGSFENGRQVGEWTTYDRKGKVVKVTVMKSKAGAAPGGAKPATKSAARIAPKRDAVAAWSAALSPAHRAICDALRAHISAAIPEATSKAWHGAPVWFLGENPVVGYSVKAGAVSLLFWNGVAFGAAALKPVGKYGAAEAVFRDADELDARAIRRWLTKAKTDVPDSKAFFQKLRAGQRPKP